MRMRRKPSEQTREVEKSDEAAEMRKHFESGMKDFDRPDISADSRNGINPKVEAGETYQFRRKKESSNAFI